MTRRLSIPLAPWFVLASLTTIAMLPSRALATAARLTVTPVVLQHAALFLSDQVTAGGIGGGFGIQTTYDARYLMQADVSALWTLGNAISTRVAVGAQANGNWSPAAWLTVGALLGDRLEFLANNGQRPAMPSWAVGLRVSPLRFRNDVGVISALEPGIATDLSGGLWLDLTVLQAGATF